MSPQLHGSSIVTHGEHQRSPWHAVTASWEVTKSSSSVHNQVTGPNTKGDLLVLLLFFSSSSSSFSCCWIRDPVWVRTLTPVAVTATDAKTNTSWQANDHTDNQPNQPASQQRTTNNKTTTTTATTTPPTPMLSHVALRFAAYQSLVKIRLTCQECFLMI